MTQADTAEPVERRALAERKAERTAGTVTQSAGQTDSGLLRLREAAKRDSRLRFNNLLHHLSIDRLERAYYALNRQAAPGVDGCSWADYGEQLHARLHELHRKRQRIDTYPMV